MNCRKENAHEASFEDDIGLSRKTKRQNPLDGPVCLFIMAGIIELSSIRAPYIDDQDIGVITESGTRQNPPK